eukprot:4752251-Pleurochrysis_carterae.AAC.1
MLVPFCDASALSSAARRARLCTSIYGSQRPRRTRASLGRAQPRDRPSSDGSQTGRLGTWQQQYVQVEIIASQPQAVIDVSMADRQAIWERVHACLPNGFPWPADRPPRR